ncbi:MAG: hypothetical protein JWO86_329 [Myxococcaceae bacterium]|nr:hypothetical protein [Myxococcaceae bacterium]MEA2750675.1 hypothetical protein [Myxococcales bacterium]
MRAQSTSLLGIAVGGLIVSFVVRVIKRSAAHHEERQRRPPADADDPRWGPDEGRVQIAGKSCAGCGDRITVAFEGTACTFDLCKAACHTKCVMRHVADEHTRRDDGAPYR